MKKKIIIILLVSISVFGLISCSIGHGENYNKYLTDKNKKYFGSRICSTIDYQCSDAEKAQVEDVLETARRVFSYVGTKENADKNVGALSRYYRYTDSLNYISVDLKLDLITAKIKSNGKSGYMWIVYSIDRYDKNGENVAGSTNIPCYWEIEKQNDRWVVTNVMEPA